SFSNLIFSFESPCRIPNAEEDAPLSAALLNKRDFIRCKESRVALSSALKLLFTYFELAIEIWLSILIISLLLAALPVPEPVYPLLPDSLLSISLSAPFRELIFLRIAVL